MSLALREERRLVVFENKIQIFELGNNKLREEWEKQTTRFKSCNCLLIPYEIKKV
jgi:hypothetical protein